MDKRLPIPPSISPRAEGLVVGVLAFDPEVRDLPGKRGSVCEVEVQVALADYRVRFRDDLASRFAKAARAGCGVAVNGLLKREEWRLRGDIVRARVVLEAESFSITADPVRRIGLVKTQLGPDRE